MVLLVAVMVVAGVARYAELGRVPQGLYMDEAADGLDALRTAASHHYQVFYPSDGGREGLWIALMSFSVRWFGRTELAVRFWSPLVGLLTIFATYGLASRWMGRRTGLLAAWLMATSFWHVLFSRVAFRGILLPLFIVSALYFLQLAWDAKGLRGMLCAALGGCCLGLGFYSYIPFRLMPLLGLVVMCGEFYGASRDRRREVLNRFGLWAAVGCVVATPLAIHFVRNPGDFSARISQVSVLGATHPGRAIAKNFVLSLKMFVLSGDQNWRHNLAGVPELGYAAAIFFLIGCVIVCRRRKVLLVWLLLMLLPAVMTNEGVPHALRSIGAMPAAILIAAAGVDWLLRRVPTKSSPALKYAIVALVVLSGASELYRYFVLWGPTLHVQQAYQAEQLLAARRLAETPESKQVIVVVEEPPSYGWRGNAVVTDVDGVATQLPVQAAIPLFIAADRQNQTYVPSSRLPGMDLTRLGCPFKQLPPRRLPENQLVNLTECSAALAGLRLTGLD